MIPNVDQNVPWLDQNGEEFPDLGATFAVRVTCKGFLPTCKRQDKPEPKCFFCHKPGHLVKNCRKIKERNQKKACRLCGLYNTCESESVNKVRVQSCVLDKPSYKEKVSSNRQKSKPKNNVQIQLNDRNLNKGPNTL